MRRGIILLVGAALAASMAVPATAAGTETSVAQVRGGLSVDQAVEVVQASGVDMTEAEIRDTLRDAARGATAGRAHGCQTVWAHFWLTVCYYVLAPYPPGTNGVIVCFDNLCVPVFLPIIIQR